jgi:biopolymer transport protein ExbD
MTMAMTPPSLTQNLDEPEVMMDINTTPLIDVMLVLLIMLIITIPVQLHSVNLDMPTGTPPAQKKPNIVRIEVDARNVVNWNGKALADRAALDAMLLEAKAQEPQPELHIKAQGKAKYEAVAGVLASAQRQGLTKIGIVGTAQFATP